MAHVGANPIFLHFFLLRSLSWRRKVCLGLLSAAVDFFSVAKVTFNVLYVFFLIGHDRRRILHFKVTRHPTSVWIAQQLREAFSMNRTPSFSCSTTMPNMAANCASAATRH
jgi:hypothetical protein